MKYFLIVLLFFPMALKSSERENDRLESSMRVSKSDKVSEDLRKKFKFLEDKMVVRCPKIRRLASSFLSKKSDKMFYKQSLDVFLAHLQWKLNTMTLILPSADFRVAVTVDSLGYFDGIELLSLSVKESDVFDSVSSVLSGIKGRVDTPDNGNECECIHYEFIFTSRYTSFQDYKKILTTQ